MSPIPSPESQPASGEEERAEAETEAWYDPFRNSETVTLRELLDDVFGDLIDYQEIKGDPYSGENALTVNSQLFADEDRPLHRVVWRGNARCVRLLLEAGADPNAKGDLGYSPLYYAVDSGNLEIARMLLEAGARIDEINEDGYSDLGLCSSKSYRPNPEMFHLLQSYWPGVVPEDLR